MSNCNNNCGSCAKSCDDRTAPQSFLIEPNKRSNIKKIIGIVSGKGGVGKSTITALLAVLMRKKGYRVGIIDGDITGPSIPNMFNIHTLAVGCEDGILPVTSKSGIDIMSMNLLLENEGESVIYRGPVVAGIVKQFYTDVIWEEIDFLFVDMPPGTGDVPLTIFQSYPLDGILIISTPQQLVSMIVSKACDMAEKMNIPVIGLIENMSFVKCPDCGKKLDLFKNSHVEEIANEYSLNILSKLPLMSEVMEAADNGAIEDIDVNYLDEVIEELENLLDTKIISEIIAMPWIDDEIFQHFGKSSAFILYTLEDNEIIKQEIINVDKGHDAIPPTLKAYNVNYVVCGGIGECARDGLYAQGIQVISGVSGKVEHNIKEFILGNLVDNVNGTCNHEHEIEDHECNCGGECHH